MRTSVALLVAALALAACGKDDPPPRQAPPKRAVPEVWTTFYPTTYFAQRIGGNLVKVVCPLPADEDPAFWKPDAAALQGFQQADLIVVNGAGFEAFAAHASLPPSRLVSTSQGFSDRWIKLEGSVTHSHGTGAAHTHEGIDGHTWVDPMNAKEQAKAIHRALVLLLPDKSAALKANAEALAKDLDALDAAFRGLGSLPKGQFLYTSHPAWNYLAKRYGWETVGLVLEPESALEDEEAAKIKAALEAKPGGWILWEDAPLPANAQRLERELGLRSLVVPPCETDDPKAGDYLARMRANVETLRAAFPGR